MKLPQRVLVAAALCVVCAAPSQAQNWMEPYNRLLGKYATSGGVKYAAWKSNAADMQALQTVVDGIAQESISGLDKRQQVAFYCNAYNAWILHEALGKYPTASVKDSLYTFFTSKRITVAGQKTSFKALEDNVIRRLGEPRIHFALNCASRSCPPLNREAFTGPKLAEQLEKLAKGYVNSERGVKYSAESKTAQLSKIFDWYKDDFPGGVGGPLGFINKRRATPIPNDTKITYQEYDWGLNEVK